MRQVEMTLVKHPGDARRTAEYAVTHTEAVLFAFWQKQRPRDDVDLVSDLSYTPAELFQPEPGATIQHGVLRAHVIEVEGGLDSFP